MNLLICNFKLPHFIMIKIYFYIKDPFFYIFVHTRSFLAISCQISIYKQTFKLTLIFGPFYKFMAAIKINYRKMRLMKPTHDSLLLCLMSV